MDLHSKLSAAERLSAKTSIPLIRAYKQGALCVPVRALIRWKLREHFHQILVQGLDTFQTALNDDPSGTLIIANHSSWWDFFMAHWMNEVSGVDGYGMTDHSNLVKFGFFRRIGAYSVDRTRPASIRASLDYTIELLQKPKSAVWLFPQGFIACNDARPLVFQGGLRLLLQRAHRLRIVPVALRYEYWQDEHPEAFARFGPPTWFEKSSKATILDNCRDHLTQELDALKTDVLSQDATRFQNVLAGRGSTHDRFAQFKARLGGPAADYSTGAGP